MDHFVEGVWADVPVHAGRGGADRRARSACTLVLVEGAIRELDRLADAGRHARMSRSSADFLGFRHYTVDRFATTMRAVDVGFVGWPGALDDPVLGGPPRRGATGWAGSSW